jgi:hypothetical protein
MIGYNHLGKNGRLGNQMFQYASLRGIADKHGYDFMIPESNLKDEWNYHQLFEAFVLTNLENTGHVSENFYKEKENGTHIFNSEYVNNCPDNVSLYGFFQSEKYFQHIAESIREDFIFKDEILNPCKEEFNFDKVISIHIRRGDYINKSHYHPLCEMEYYENALEKFDYNIPVIIFSDDIKWCKKQSLFSSDRFMVSDTGWNLVDLCLMTMCSHHIIANSSFSWWGAWLSRSDNVIAPKKWYGPAAKKLLTDDLIPERWQTL